MIFVENMLQLIFFIGECSLYFLANILPEVQAANLSLQRRCTTGVNLHMIITTLLRKLNNRLQDDFFGSKVSQLLKNIQCSIEVDALKKSFRSFIRSLILYIEKYYNNYAPFYHSISIFNEISIQKIEWKSIQHCSSFIDDEMIDQDGLYNDFIHIKSKYVEMKEKFGGINKQIRYAPNPVCSRESRVRPFPGSVVPGFGHSRVLVIPGT
jgi:hypothetical protein